MTEQVELTAPRRGASGLVHALFSVLFPDRCRLCDQPMAEITRVPVCRACLDSLEPLRPEAGLCRRCGIPRLTALGDDCEHCAAEPPSFDRARSYGVYDGPLRRVVHLFKYYGMRPLAAPLAERMAAVWRAEGWDGAGLTAIVAVPLAGARQRERGFNQSQLLARELARRVKLPAIEGACRRVRPTAVQTGLTRSQRVQNVRAAFTPGPRAARVNGAHVLLVDDVLTTGATLEACARALRAAGAQRVFALTAARTLEH